MTSPQIKELAHEVAVEAARLESLTDAHETMNAIVMGAIALVVLFVFCLGAQLVEAIITSHRRARAVAKDDERARDLAAVRAASEFNAWLSGAP